eukprot:3030329-Rhodomonas_salina.5
MPGTDIAHRATSVGAGLSGTREERREVQTPLWAYACAMRCPVLTYGVGLRYQPMRVLCDVRY